MPDLSRAPLAGLPGFSDRSPGYRRCRAGRRQVRVLFPGILMSVPICVFPVRDLSSRRRNPADRLRQGVEVFVGSLCRRAGLRDREYRRYPEIPEEGSGQGQGCLGYPSLQERPGQLFLSRPGRRGDVYLIQSHSRHPPVPWIDKAGAEIEQDGRTSAPADRHRRKADQSGPTPLSPTST